MWLRIRDSPNLQICNHTLQQRKHNIPRNTPSRVCSHRKPHNHGVVWLYGLPGYVVDAQSSTKLPVLVVRFSRGQRLFVPVFGHCAGGVHFDCASRVQATRKEHWNAEVAKELDLRGCMRDGFAEIDGARLYNAYSFLIGHIEKHWNESSRVEHGLCIVIAHLQRSAYYQFILYIIHSFIRNT